MSEGLDMELPEIAAPDPETYVKSEPEVEADQKKTAIAFGFIGVGQAGGKLANEFYRLGYRKVLVLNTAKNDFMGLEIPANRQLVMGDGSGAGKDPTKGEAAVLKQKDDILSLMKRTFGDSVERILVCGSAGGGTGNGGLLPVVDIAKEYLAELGKPSDKQVGALVALPKDSERGSAQVQSAALMEKLFERAAQDIAPLIMVDNEQIAKQWPSASIAEVFTLANRNVCGLFDIFNTLACRPSQYSSFDKADLESVLSKGAVVYGATTLKQVDSASAISDAIRQNLNRGLLVEGIDLSTAQAGAGVLVGAKASLDVIPSSYVDEAFKTLSRVLGSDKKTTTVHQGVFETSKPNIFLYTIAGGVSLPEARLARLKKG